ncbi:hypothetical protein ABIA65_003381 [Mycolicibacterium sp. 624]
MSGKWWSHRVNPVSTDRGTASVCSVCGNLVRRRTTYEE